MNYTNRTAVITGASRGLGAGLARTFAERGLCLGLCARTACALPDGDTVVTAQLDMGDEAAVDAFATRVVERFGAIDLWINNAGILEPIAPLRDVTSEEFAAQLRVNVLGIVHGTRTFVHHVRSRDGEGVLINISSGAARKPYAGWSAYCACKAAVDRLTECVQEEEGDAGLRAYAVAPGVIDTDMQRLIRASDAARFPQIERFKQMKANNAFNTPAFIAEALLGIAFDPSQRPQDVLVRLPDEHA